MQRITNYRRLDANKIYEVFDSEGDSFVYLFRGYQYSEDLRGDELIFWFPGTIYGPIPWCAEEFQYAFEVIPEGQ